MKTQALACYSLDWGCGKGRGDGGIHISVSWTFNYLERFFYDRVGKNVQSLEIGGRFASIHSSVVFHNFKFKTFYLQNKKIQVVSAQ